MTDNKLIFGLTHLRAKQFLSLGGVLFLLYLAAHYYGLAFIFVSDGLLNHHAAELLTNPFIWMAELGLAAVFLMHVIVAIGVIKNTGGVMKKLKVLNMRTVLAYSTRITGPIVLLFVIVHLWEYRFNQPEDFQFAEMMRAHFKSLLNVLWYSFAGLVIGLHCCQGVWAATVSWGIARTQKAQDMASKIAIGIGFLVWLFPTYLAFWLYFGGQG